MKIALFITNFPESSLSLCEALSKAGHQADLYYCTTKRNLNETAGFEFKTNRRRWGGIYEINYNQSKGVSYCRRYPQSHVYIYQSPKMGGHAKGIVRWCARKIFLFYLSRFVNSLRKERYEFVDVINQIPCVSDIRFMLKDIPHVFSFHEVLVSHMGKEVILPIVDAMIQSGECIRVFSEKSYLDVINYGKIIHKSKKISVVPFGLFTNYLDFGNNVTIPAIEQLDKFVLFFGQIHPYKGLSVLYEAVKILTKQGKDIFVVVAGKGSDDCLPAMKEDKHFIVINRFISNDETAYLMQKCRFVVCPYLSVSQSGIPQTAFAFGTPIIASAIGMFSELIKPYETGLLAPPNNAEKLADLISELYSNDELYDKFHQQVSKYEDTYLYNNWGNIVKQYEELICNCKKTNVSILE